MCFLCFLNVLFDITWVFPDGSDGKESTYKVGDPGLIQVGKIPWRRERLPTPVFLPGEFHGQKSLVGYSQWVSKELEMIEQLTLLEKELRLFWKPSVGRDCLFYSCLWCPYRGSMPSTQQVFKTQQFVVAWMNIWFISYTMHEWMYDLQDILLSEKMYNNSYRIWGEGICKFWIEVKLHLLSQFEY